jgi:hypothetical protein
LPRLRLLGSVCAAKAMDRGLEFSVEGGSREDSHGGDYHGPAVLPDASVAAEFDTSAPRGAGPVRVLPLGE